MGSPGPTKSEKTKRSNSCPILLWSLFSNSDIGYILQGLYLLSNERGFAFSFRYLAFDGDTGLRFDELAELGQHSGEDSHLNRAGEVDQFHENHTLVIFGQDVARFLDHAADDGERSFGHFGEFGDVAVFGQEFVFISFQRMTGDVEAQELLLPGKFVFHSGGGSGG